MNLKQTLAGSAKPLYLLLVIIILAGVLAACGDSSPSVDTSHLEVITASNPVKVSPNAAQTTTAAVAATTVTADQTTVVAATTNLAVSTTETSAATTMDTSTTNAPSTRVATTTTAAPSTANVTTQAAITQAATTKAAAVSVPAIKSGVLLSPMYWEPQTWNNCAPMSIIFALSYYGVKLTQKDMGHAMRPNDGDKHVTPEELVAAIQQQGFKTVARENGNLDTLRKFLSAGIPVITQQWLHDPDDIGHYRVARGYDLSKNTFIYNDSMDRHAETVVPADLEDKLWKGFDRRYFPVYTAAQEPLVMAMLAGDADPAANMQNALTAARQATESKPQDIDAWRNLGYLDYAMGDYKAAIGVWEQHLTKMLTPSDNGPYNRFLWYQLWPVESYNKLGNYQQVLKMAPNEIDHAKVFAEARYEYAIALMNTNQRDAAINQLKTSLTDDSNFKPGRAMLAKLGVSVA